MHDTLRLLLLHILYLLQLVYAFIYCIIYFYSYTYFLSIFKGLFFFFVNNYSDRGANTKFHLEIGL